MTDQQRIELPLSSYLNDISLLKSGIMAMKNEKRNIRSDKRLEIYDMRLKSLYRRLHRYKNLSPARQRDIKINEILNDR